MHSLSSVAPKQAGARVVYSRAGLMEWCENRAGGLEQGFIVAERPDGHGDVDFEALSNGNGHSHEAPSGRAAAAGGSAAPHGGTAMLAKTKAQSAAERLLQQYKLKCPDCGSGALSCREGCMYCQSCGFSKC